MVCDVGFVLGCDGVVLVFGWGVELKFCGVWVFLGFSGGGIVEGCCWVKDDDGIWVWLLVFWVCCCCCWEVGLLGVWLIFGVVLVMGVLCLVVCCWDFLSKWVFFLVWVCFICFCLVFCFVLCLVCFCMIILGLWIICWGDLGWVGGVVGCVVVLLLLLVVVGLLLVRRLVIEVFFLIKLGENELGWWSVFLRV